MWPDGGGCVRGGGAARRQCDAAQSSPAPGAHLALCAHRRCAAAPPARPRGRVARRSLTSVGGQLANRAIVAVVLYPGTILANSTSPPAFLTMSPPTTSSKR